MHRVIVPAVVQEPRRIRMKKIIIGFLSLTAVSAFGNGNMIHSKTCRIRVFPIAGVHSGLDSKLATVLRAKNYNPYVDRESKGTTEELKLMLAHNQATPGSEIHIELYDDASEPFTFDMPVLSKTDWGFVKWRGPQRVARNLVRRSLPNCASESKDLQCDMSNQKAKLRSVYTVHFENNEAKLGAGFSSLCDNNPCSAVGAELPTRLPGKYIFITNQSAVLKLTLKPGRAGIYKAKATELGGPSGTDYESVSYKGTCTTY